MRFLGGETLHPERVVCPKPDRGASVGDLRDDAAQFEEPEEGYRLSIGIESNGWLVR